MLKQNGYQESIITTISKRVTNNHSLLQSQQKKIHSYSRGRDQNEYKFTVR